MAGYYDIVAKADPKHLEALAIMVGLSSANDRIEHGAMRADAEWYGQVLSPLAEGLDIWHSAVENYRTEAEVEAQIDELKKKLRCR